MSDSPKRYRAVCILPTEALNSMDLGHKIGMAVKELLIDLGSQGECNWPTLLVAVRRTEELGHSGLPDLLSASVEIAAPEITGGAA